MNNKILIIEDDRPMLDSLELLFLQEGYQVMAIESAALIATSMSTFKPDILLMDIRLKDGDGRLICDDIKNNLLTRDLPIILLTALSYQEISEFESLADAVIGKPYQVQTLIRTANQLLRIREIKP